MSFRNGFRIFENKLFEQKILIEAFSKLVISMDKSKQSENSEKSQENDDELDITSENFNPLKALYSNDMKLPVKNVKRLDNLAVFMSRLKNAENKIDSEVN